MEAEAPRSRRKLAAILMVDVSGFSRLMGSDEEWTTREIRAFHQRVEAQVLELEGRVVDTAGDSVFAEFDSVVNATRCAQAIQAEQARQNESLPDQRRIDTRIGVHVGDVIVEEYKVYGDGVNIAARLESLAQPGHILVSEAVYQQVHNKISGEFRDEGVRTLKNIEHPVRVYSLVPSALATLGARGAPASIRPPTRREERLARRSRATSRVPALPPEPRSGSLVDALLRPDVATPLVIGALLLATPTLGFASGGAFPTAGGILVGLSVGRALGRARGRSGFMLIGIGIGIAAGGRFTQWSPVTNLLFVLGGAIVALQGIAARRRGRSRRLPPG
ncbi:MAG TPA: adenylate/guanylate cyclase domain-containing protein [Myxococcota bacterium]|nr:adenylate/guanylate cyclase domain-containing protein [Myxococcota bacterium]